MTSVSEYITRMGSRVPELSAKTTIPVERLEALGRGAEPTVGELRRFAAALDMSISDLLPHTDTQQKAQLLFRTTAAKKRRQPPVSVDRLAGLVGRAFDILPPVRRTCAWLSSMPEGRPTRTRRRAPIGSENYSLLVIKSHLCHPSRRLLYRS